MGALTLDSQSSNSTSLDTSASVDAPESTDAVNPSIHTSLPRPPLNRWQWVREVGEIVIMVVAIYALVNMLSMRYIIDGPSMQRNFYTDQFILVSRLNYLWSNPTRGDIIVFHRPDTPQVDLIKRVIGEPGDLVEIRERLVYVNGVQLNEPYINEPCNGSCGDRTVQLGADEFFVMGDNRNHSTDSRVFGPVRRDLIVGEAIVRYWPLNEIAIVNRIAYPD